MAGPTLDSKDYIKSIALPNITTSMTSNTTRTISSSTSVPTTRTASTSTTPDLPSDDKQWFATNLNDTSLYSEGDSTVVHYEITKTSNPSSIFLNSLNEYILQYNDTRTQRNNEIRTIFEEFKFDIIANHLSSPSQSCSLNNSPISNETNEDFVVINLNTTPYSTLIHSLKPQIFSICLIQFLKSNVNKLSKKSIITILLLSLSLLNMISNSMIGLKLYAKMIINRTRKLFISLINLEKNIVQLSRNRVRSNDDNKLNIICSFLHSLICAFVKRINNLVNYVGDVGWLWKYLVVYGLDSDCEENKILRNILKHDCPCAWKNESGRLVRALQYVRRICLCVIMAIVEEDGDQNNKLDGDEDEEKGKTFMRRFWKKFGITDDIENFHNLSFGTRLLGVVKFLEQFRDFVEILKLEMDLEDLNIGINADNSFNNTNNSLEVLVEKNEDDRIRELSGLVDKIGYQLDMVELGMKDSSSGLDEIKNDLDDFMNCYNDLTGNKKEMSVNGTKRKSGFELKKLRMSDILLDEGDEEKEEDTGIDFNINLEKEKRRSSGLKFSLVTVVNDGNEEEITREGTRFVKKDEVDGVKDKEELKKTLERLCGGKKKTVISNEIDETAFAKFKEELCEHFNDKKEEKLI